MNPFISFFLLILLALFTYDAIGFLLRYMLRLLTPPADKSPADELNFYTDSSTQLPTESVDKR